MAEWYANKIIEHVDNSGNIITYRKVSNILKNKCTSDVYQKTMLTIDLILTQKGFANLIEK